MRNQQPTCPSPKKGKNTMDQLNPIHRLALVMACASLAGPLSLPAGAQDSQIGPLIELSRPNAVGSCDDGFDVFGTWPLDDAAEPFVAVNPANPKNIVAEWIQGPIQNNVAAASLDGGRTWQQVPIPLTVCSGGPFLGAAD